MNRKELSAVIAETTARIERAAALQHESVMKAEAGRAKHEEAIEAARARQEEAQAKQEETRAKQEEAVARQEAATARLEEIQAGAAERNTKLDGTLAKLDDLIEKVEAGRVRREADYEDEKIWREEYLRRQEKMFQDFLLRADAAMAEARENTEKILARIDDQRDDLRAMREAILKLIDRFPPPPPHLRSA
ncbi:MAG TPA: hypothetical protein VHH14_04260 [Solirubrobacterales bacterium]|nr:hypothetical protein [Solirubrobacterales bacterium]